MRVLVQRVKMANVMISGNITGNIGNGLLLFVGFNSDDIIEDIKYLINKILNLRIFDDNEGKMNLNIKDVNGKILSISQFTLYADCKKGNRPSFVESMEYNKAKQLYEQFNILLNEYIKVETGIFGSNMQVSLINDGPVTILLESNKKVN